MSTDRARLEAVHECAGDNAYTCKPATYFSWKGGNPPGFSEITTPVLVPEAQGASLMTMDVTGDGLDDLVLPDLNSFFGTHPAGDFLTDWQVSENQGASFQDKTIWNQQIHPATDIEAVHEHFAADPDQAS